MLLRVSDISTHGIKKLAEMGYIKLESQKGQGNRKSFGLTGTGNEFCDKYVRSIIDGQIM